MLRSLALRSCSCVALSHRQPSLPTSRRRLRRCVCGGGGGIGVPCVANGKACNWSATIASRRWLMARHRSPTGQLALTQWSKAAAQRDVEGHAHKQAMLGRPGRCSGWIAIEPLSRWFKRTYASGGHFPMAATRGEATPAPLARAAGRAVPVVRISMRNQPFLFSANKAKQPKLNHLGYGLSFAYKMRRRSDSVRWMWGR